MGEECVDAANKVLKNEPTVENIRFHAHDRLCFCHLKEGNTMDSKKSCTEAIRIDDQPRLYCERAEAYLAEDMFDEAISDYRAALERDEGFSRAKEGMAKAQKLQKQAGKRDYYKILGVKRSATKKEIKKAYKAMALEWHPDKFQDEEEKKAAEKKFMDIAAAKEVLTDAEKRAKYDAGEDPLDPEGGGGDHPFNKEDFIFLVAIHLVVVPSSSSFISIETDLMAFTQILFTLIPFLVVILIFIEKKNKYRFWIT